jgi:hypothetical protein
VGRAAFAAAVFALAALATPATAAAHQHSGRIAVDYRATVAPLGPALTHAVAVRVYRADLALGLRALGRHRVMVLGFTGEPFLRLGADGTYANRSSLTAAGLGFVRPRSGTGWQLVSRAPGLIWHDARLRGLPPGVRHGRWSVPVVVDGTRTELSGTLERVPAPPAWPWLVVGAGVALVAGTILALRRPRLLRTGATAFGWIAVGVTILVSSGFAAASTSTEGTWTDTGTVILFALIGTAFLLLGSSDGRALAGGILGLLALVVGLTDLAVLWRGEVLSALPANLARTGVVLAIAAGSSALVLGVVVFLNVVEHYEEPSSFEPNL